MPKNDYLVEIFPLAEADLNNIYAYYFAESQERQIAEKLVNSLKEAILGLTFMPNSNPQIKEPRLRKDGFKKLICGEYVIPFLIDEEKKTVSVIRIFHGKMNYQKYL